MQISAMPVAAWSFRCNRGHKDMALILKNNATTYLSAAITSTDTSIPVTDSSVFPALGAGDYFYATIQSTSGNYEIVKVTNVSASAVSATRAQEDTVAIPFVAGSVIEIRLTEANVTGAVIADDYLIL